MIIKDGVQGRNYYRDEDIERFRYNPYRRANREKAERAYHNDEHLPFPLHVIIETSSLCQLKCKFCNREVLERPQMNMDMKTFRRVVDECAENGVYSLSLYALGEPFLNPEIREMVVYAKGRGIPYVDISTNGMIPMKKILGAGLDEIIVSLDGPKIIHERLRPGANFDQVVMNTMLLKQERDRAGLTRPLIRVQTINFAEDYPDKQGKKYDLQEFIDWAMGLGDVVYLKNVEAFSQSLGAKNLEVQDIDKRKATRKPCKQLYFVMTVNSDGSIAYCCHAPRGDANLGLIKDRTLKDVWDNELREIREKHVAGKLTPLCEACVDYSW